MKDWAETLYLYSIVIILLVFLFTDVRAADSNIYYKDQPPASATVTTLLIEKAIADPVRLTFAFATVTTSVWFKARAIPVACTTVLGTPSDP